MSRHVTATLRTERLELMALEAADALEMVGVLADLDLYAFTGGEPPSLERLEARYRAQVAGSPRPGEDWHNSRGDRPGGGSWGRSVHRDRMQL